jgi:crotonobetainyl-CoA:carnitine CoA-transferase CaiB-like acyl-CoA transferase
MPGMTRALDGIGVLDLATFVAAPFCATLLGEFGAEVIKVEQPGVGDDLRRLGHRSPDGPSYFWLVEARNKKSITCNLRAPDGQDLVRRLAARADIVAENFRPGTMERWGLGYEDLRRLNPGLVMVRISAFGQTGPARERPGFGRIAAAVSGASYICGYQDRPPVPPGTPTIPDYLAGVMAAFGALLALHHRGHTGQGQVVDVALYEPFLRMLDEMIPRYAAHGHVRERIGSGTEYVVPHDHYQAQDGRWIAIACTNDRMFERLARDAMQRPDLLERFTTVADRIAGREDLDGQIRAWVGRRASRDALAELEGAAVPCSLVASVREVFEDPQVKARDNIIAARTALGTLVTMAGVVPKLSLTPGAVDATGPVEPGAHNEEIYGGRLGLSAAELADLRTRGAI